MDSGGFSSGDTVTIGQKGSLVQRMIRAARLEPGLYEEVEADQTATNAALIVVVIVAVCNGLGAALGLMLRGASGRAPGALIGEIVSAVIGWLIWSYLAYFIGTRLFDGRATPGEMLRTIGFSHSPGVLNILGFIPVLGPLVRLVVFFWLLVAGVVAVRQALDFDTGKAILTTIIGWLVPVILIFVLGAIGIGAGMALGG
jgi:hypothetical protein